MTPTFSLHAYAELRDALARVNGTQLILPAEGQDLEIQGGEGDRAATATGCRPGGSPTNAPTG
jgi:hypothetical protein